MKNFHLPLYIFLLSLFSFTSATAQRGMDFSGEINIKGAGSNGERLPFWMYHNQRGRLSEDSNISSWISTKATKTFASGDTLQFGGGLLYHDGIGDDIFIDELYAMYQTHWLRIQLGRKQDEQLYNGLSSSNRSILKSLNARPLPGIEVRSRNPLFGEKGYGLGFDFSWGEYYLGEEGQVQDIRVHHKSFHMVYRTEDDLQLKGGLVHYAQWAGETASRKKPGDLENYFRVAAGNGGANHIMGWEASLSKSFDTFYVEAFYQHIMEDGSGPKLGNAPDGRYGIFLKSADPNKFFNSIMYEFYTTHNKSRGVDGLPDNYFNDAFYTSGWTYENRVIGAPFFTTDPEGEGIVNNRFTVHHLGIGGQPHTYFETFPFRFLASYARNEGTYAEGYEEAQDVISLFYEQRVYQGFLEVSFQAGMEFNPEEGIYGLGVKVRKEF